MQLWNEFSQGKKIAVAIGAVVVVGVAGMVAVQARPSRAPVPMGERAGLSVALVTPPDAELVPGGVMEVGDLVDGYEHRQPPPMEPVLDAAYVEADPDWPAPDEADYGPVHVYDQGERAPRRQVETTSSTGSRFGFDAPQPDYAAERRARQERMDRAQSPAREDPRVMRSDSYFQ
ncbi:hypothetical protein [Brevundimonas sp.]|uniref:hypothetical protein n=1 Tax=Brevundimonas sp. TaxID=1871086 RepID=UPI002ABBE498|nr:hypothetical protein [Brevundimonas sp.]MDZ4364575.1 hypothetical protein [Brevundimonas sp.]